MKAALFWSAALSFCLGIGLRSLVPISLEVGLALLLLGVVLLLQRNRTIIVLGCAVCACGLGALRMEAGILERDVFLDNLLETRVVLEGVVVEEPDTREANTRLLIRADTLLLGDDTHAVDAGVLVVAPLHAGVSYGNRIRAEGELRSPQSFETGEGRAFNYPGYLAARGVLYELSFADVSYEGETFAHPLKHGAIALKKWFLSGLTFVLPEPSAGLAGGITAGDKRGLGPELSKDFQVVGLTHIIVLSGYNIMVVVFALSWVFAKAGLSRRGEACAGIGIAVLFAFMTGLASASVRAALMASISIIGKATGRVYLAGRALALVALFMLLWNPYLLVFDVGFQLSVVATWGLIALSPVLGAYLGFVTERFGLKEILAATLSTQLAVLPLLLYQSGELGVLSLLANMLVLVAVPWAMLFSAIAGVSGAIGGFLALPLALPAHALLSYIVFIAETLASLPFASVSIPAFSAWWLLPVYGALALLARRSLTEAPRTSSQ